jgi:hypothetical protein
MTVTETTYILVGTAYQLDLTTTTEECDSYYTHTLQSASFLKGLGGVVNLIGANTSQGHKVVKWVAYSADRTVKLVRNFKFN